MTKLVSLMADELKTLDPLGHWIFYSPETNVMTRQITVYWSST